MTPPRHYLIPGLLGPAPTGKSDLPRLPALDLLAARADREVVDADFVSTAFGLFGHAVDSSSDLPSAAIRYAAVTGVEPDGWVMRADPVSLVADRDQLVLFPVRPDDLDDELADVFCESFNRHVVGERLRLVAARADDWYLLSERDPEITTSALQLVSGRSIDGCLPSGTRASYWRSLLNDAQMLLHQINSVHEVDTGRAGPVNGIWLSGVGRLPARTRTRIGSVQGENRLVDALSRRAEAVENEQLVVDCSLFEASLAGDAVLWVDRLVALDALLGEAMTTGPLRVYSCGAGVFDWRPSMRRRIWRRRRPQVL